MINSLEELFTLENLNNAFYEESQASYWKEQTQRYRANLLINNTKLQNELLSNSYKVQNTTNFQVNERGRIRDINAPTLRDAIVQKVINQHILIPQLSKYFIYDNYASIKKRGTKMARKRVNIMLQKHMKQYGNSGYIIQIDVKNFFGSIDHQILKSMLDEKLNISNDIKDLIHYLIDNSSSTNVGLNLGAEMPQTLSGFYLTPLDNYIKTVLGIKFYARYADDMLLCVPTKQEAHSILEQIKSAMKSYKLSVSEKKTHIVKLSHGFIYLKNKYNIINNRIIIRPVHAKIQRERKRLKAYKRLYDKNIVTDLEVQLYYYSWSCNIRKECNRIDKSLQSIYKLLLELFPKCLQAQREIQYRDELIDEIFKNNYKLLYS